MRKTNGWSRIAGGLSLAAPLLITACVGSIGGDDAKKKTPTSEDTTALPSPLARLTSDQYATTLHDLFAPVVIPDVTLPGGATVDDFDNNAGAQTPSPAMIDALHGNALAVTTAAMQNPSAVLGCSPTSRADEDACASAFIASFTKKAYRHPLVDADTADLLQLYSSTRADGTTDFNTAMSLVIETILQEPDFVYRVEVGKPIAGDATRVQLTGYEMANRLSYFLWNTMPDEALFAAAEAGELDTQDGVEKSARRLLADPRAHAAIREFHSEWLRFSMMDKLTKDSAMFPEFSDDAAQSMRDSASAYVDSIFFGDGTLTALLTDSHAWVNDSLAPVYGVSAPGSAELQWVSVDPTQRSGVLTNAGIMAGFAHETADSPVLRGVWVLDRFLCSAPPPPPKNVNTTLPSADPGAPMTTRDRFATEHEQGACASCHHTIDGIGFGFEHYDAIGQWRTEDNGLPVDSSGWFPPDSGNLTGTFDGAVDLGQKLAASDEVHSCVAASWLRYALGVDHTGIAGADLTPIVENFEKSGLELPELVVGLTTSDAFRTRRIAP